METKHLHAMRSAAMALLMSASVCPVPGCGGSGDRPGPERRFVVEEIDGDAVVQLYLDEFEELTGEEKIFASYLTMAAIVGRDITFDQHHRDALRIRRLLEAVVENREDLDRSLFERIHRYTKLFWINNGPYDEHTGRKIIPGFTPDEFRTAAVWAYEAGAFPEFDSEEDLSRELAGLEQVMFDPVSEPVLTNKNPGPGLDVLTGSANNLYHEVTLAEAEAFDERYPLNSRLARVGGEVTEQVYRAGGNGVPPGLYSSELGRVIAYLEKSLPYASPGQEEMIRHLIDHFRTGDPEAREKADFAWVRTDPKVDITIGFIEVYLDPRAVKGEYQALVTVRDEEMTRLMRGLAENAQYFEDRMPWEERYRKKGVEPPVASAVKVLTATGDAGPLCVGGVNLPNGQEFREKYGSKSIMLTNVLEAVRAARGSKLTDEFSFDEREQELKSRFAHEAGNLLIALHEVLGHGSGKVAEHLTEDPSAYLKEYYNTLEEARADLVALWHIGDERLRELGLSSGPEVAETLYRYYVTRDLTGLAAVPHGDQFEEDHHRGRHLIVSHLMEKGAVSIREREGRHYYVVDDLELMRTEIGGLLAELMRIKAEGDYEAIKGLVDRYGTKFDPVIRDEVVNRAREVGLPQRFPCVMPDVVPIPDEAGRITDVDIHYPRDFTEQMMSYSKMR